MTLKLYYHPFSTYSRRVLIALIEKKIAYQPIIVDMAARKHRDPVYLALNPYGRVPTIEEDGFVLYESTAILNYLEMTHPTPPLIPSDKRQRALVDMHMKLCDLQMSRPSGAIIFPKRFLAKDRWDETAISLARGEIEKHFAILDRHLNGKNYLIGDDFSLADLCYLPFVEFLPLMEITPPPNVALWVARLLERPSAKETLPER